MADYYPLLSRAVSGLGSSNEAARRAIYDRARKALLGQLQSIQPPVPQADIDREAKALDEAVARVEAEIAVTAAIGEAVSASPEPGPAQAPPAAPAQSPPPVVAAAPAAPLAPSPPVVARPAAASPAAPVVSPPAGTPKPAMEPAAPVAPPPVSPAPTLATGLRPPAPSRAPSIPSTPSAPNLPSAPALPPALAEPPAEQQPAAPPSPPPRAPAPPAGRRPAAGTAQIGARKSKSGLYTALALLVLMAAGAGGYLAWSWRLLPEQLSKPRSSQTTTAAPATPPAQSTPAAPPPEQRIVQRVPAPGAAPAETPPATPAQTASQSQPAVSAQPQPQTPPAGSGVPVAQRAAILIAAPTKESPDGVDTRIGTVVWRTDTVTRDAGQPPSSAIRADIDIQPAGIKAVVTIEKNLDATLPASHMITIRFQREDNNATGEIGDIETIQMRDLQSPQVESLESARVKITSNIFIVALTQSEAITKRNVDAMLARGWIDIPMKLTDGRLAKITLEKGAPGERIFKEAFERWAQ